MWRLTILLLPAVLFFCRAVPWSYYHSLFHPLLIMMWLKMLNYVSAADFVKFVLLFNGNFVLHFRLLWHNLVFPVIKESFYFSIPKSRAHAFFNLIQYLVICTSIHLSLFSLCLKFSMSYLLTACRKHLKNIKNAVMQDLKQLYKIERTR
jgi:hypothetical protein